MKNTATSKAQWFSTDRVPPIDFSSPIEAWGYRHFRRWVWLLCKFWPTFGVRVVVKYLYGARRFPRPNRERELLKQAESFSLDFEDGALACWRFAPLQSEPALKTAVLIHGWEGRAAQLGSLVEPLQRRGYQVYLMDLPAHGDSDGFRSNPMKAAKALLRLGQKLPQIDLLVAHSFGAYASMLAMHRGLMVSRFISLAGVVDYRATMRDVRIMFNVPASAKSQLDRQIAAEIGADWDELNILSTAASISIPCVYMHDPADEDTPFWGAEEMVAALPIAELIAVANVGHRKILWAPDVINFLSQGG